MRVTSYAEVGVSLVAHTICYMQADSGYKNNKQQYMQVNIA